MTFFLVALVLAIAIDITSKYLTYYRYIELIPEVLSIHFERNFGAAFSMLDGAVLFLIIISSVFILGLGAFYILHTRRKKIKGQNVPKFFHIGFGLFLGGALGNLFDRIFFGYVRDFIRLDFVNFPIFNFADIFINIGLVMIIIYLLFFDRKSFFKSNKKETTTDEPTTESAADSNQ
ncbi:MAG: signal peptidase II [Firmicutes bacterium]|nr:signal peptidase II [Bacillota bacterium]